MDAQINPTTPSRAGADQAGPARAGTGGGGRQSGGAGRNWRQLSTLFESLPPHAIEAEMSLLGSILIDPQVLGDVIFVVRRGEDFSKPANGAIFDMMVALYDKHSSLDIVQLNQALVDRNVLDAVGGVEYLVQLASAVPSASNAVHYARLVREKATIRQLIAAAGDILHDAYHSADDARTILDQAEAKIFHIAQQTDSAQIESLQDLIRQTMEKIEASLGQDLTGLPSGFRELDIMTTGLQAGEMIIIAARPSMGKTALALNIAENMATHGHGVGVFSLEMGKQQLVQRLLCARSGIDSQRLRRNMLRDQEYRALMAACDELQQAPIYIDDTPGLSLLQLRAKARRMAAKHKIDCVLIDYLQLMTAGGRVESRQIEVSEISRGVKAMARELQVPVVCLSQLNRAAEAREGHRPRMSDLRESGSLEQDADVVMLLHREDYYHKDDPDWVHDNPELQGVAELIVTKQRNGPTGTVKLSWIAQSTRFRDHSSATPPAGYGGGGGGGGMTFEPKPASAVPARRASSPAMSGYGGGGAGTSAGARSEPPPFNPGSHAPANGGFASRPRTGPVQNFRDGGGPATDDDDDPSNLAGGDGDEFDGLPV